MIDLLIRFSLRNRSAVVAVALLISITGFWLGGNLPVDVFPDLNRPTVAILTEAHGLAPEEVETLVTFPLEVTMNGIPGLKRMRSSSGVGLSMLWLEFDWGSDIFRNRQLVSERLIQAKDSLPADVQPVMGPITSIMGEIQLVGITTKDESISPMQLRSIADWVVRPRLLSIPGIAQAIPMGGGVKQYQILLSTEELKKRNLPLGDIKENLRHISENTTGGFFDADDKENLVRILGRIEFADDIENAYVGEFQGRAVTVKDVATVKVGHRVKRGDASVNGQDAVIIAVKKQPGTSTLHLTAEVDKALLELKKTLPEGIVLNGDLFKQADFVEHAIDNVKEAVRDGAILVVIILFLFLMSVRTTVITLTAIPVSLAITFMVFRYFGLEINTMTLGGLAIAVGLLVDDAIVDVENVFRRLRENVQAAAPKPRMQVVFRASKEIRSSIIFATFIVVLSFLPMFFLSGLEGRFFVPLGVAFIVSLLASLLVSLSLTPVLCSFLLTDKTLKKAEHEPKLTQMVKNADRFMLERILRKPALVLAPTVLLFILAVLLATRFSSEFLPEFDEGTALLSVILPPGVSLEYSNNIGRQVEAAVGKIPEVVSISRRTGRAELDEHAEGVNNSEIDIDFSREGRDRDIVLQEIREKVEKIAPQAGVNLGQPISHRLDHMLSGVNAQVALKVFGEDRSRLIRMANEIHAKIRKVPGIVDSYVERQVSIPQVKSYLIREDANRYNVNAGKVADMLELALKGETTAQMIEGNKLTDIFIRLDDKSRNNLAAIQQTLIKVMPDGSPVLLSDIADVFESEGPNLINRENMQRRVVVQANVAGRPLSDVVADIRKIIDNETEVPEGYFVALEGQFENQQKAARTVALLSLVSLFMIVFLLFSHFRSMIMSLQVLLNIPLAFIGAVFALHLSGGVLSLASLVAFVTLCGIASRNGILMLSHYIHLMRYEGEKFSTEMIMRGSLERLVPVLMTAISAILALLPLVFAEGQPGKEILHPVALVIVGGLLSSTLLDIWVTPAVFQLIGREAAEKSVSELNKEEEQL